MKQILILLCIALVSCQSATDKRIEKLKSERNANLVLMEVYFQKAKREKKKALLASGDSTLSRYHRNKSIDYIIKADSLKIENIDISVELLRLREL